MAILIDPPVWPAWGTVFSHLVSDESLAELHAFARANGVPVAAFDRDHYDVPERLYQPLITAGAQPVRGTELIRRLIGSGLRVRGVDRNPGRVTLVGGGPGALDLLTIRGLRALEKADVIVADRLGPTDELDQLGLSARIIHVGKTPHHHPIPQHEINRILVREAQVGNNVVRLKGGDPYVLGRGGEELLYCYENGIAVDVVPGVTSAFAAPLAGGVPVTHRGVSTGVLVLSGHDELALPALAAWPHTIVILMGMARLAEMTSGLVGEGKNSATPAAVVHSAWTPKQRVVRGTLADIAQQCAEQNVANPSVIVIGDVVGVLPEAAIMDAVKEYVDA